MSYWIAAAGIILALALPGFAAATPLDVPIVVNGPTAPLPPPSGPPSAPPPVQCSLSFSPPAPTIPSSTPSGTSVSTIVTNCTPTFTAPNFDDGGLFVISGNQLVINPQGPGVAALGGTAQHVTLIASP